MGDYPPTNNSFRPSQQPSSTYSRAPFGSSGNSPPTPSFRSDIFGQTATNKSSAQIYSTSPTAERHPADRVGIMPALAASTSDPSAFGVGHAPAVVIRRLPRTIGTEALKSMLIFAGDLIDVEFIRSPYPDDQGFATAVARFQTLGSAFEVQQKLNGKPNTTKEANMIVEAHGGGAAVGNFERRNTIDGVASRTQTSSASSASSNGGPGRSRFGSTFQSTEKRSPPLPNSTSAGEFPVPESSAHFQNLFSPQSPLANGDHRVSGKSMINDDSVDDETGELLKDPVAYAISGQQPLSRRTTNPQIPVGRFASLSLSSPSGVNTNMMAMTNGYTSPRGNPMQNGASPMTPTNGSNMTNGNYAPPNFPRPQYPPVNPADQNPPCNTLYVGNLPIDTSEDELKGLFSKQRGYKRLCFRTKQNGPMCFVEFEDISFATKALHELYGHPLHNSVKGGIRLSFSKNPLGVRSGQTNGMGANAVMSPQAMPPGYGGTMNGGNFSSVSGPPPGLGSPPGIMNGNPPGLMNGNGPALTNGAAPAYINGNGGYRPQTAASIDGMFANPFGMPSPDFVGQIAPRNYSGGVPPALGSGTYSRDNRNGYNDFPDYVGPPNSNYPNGNYPNDDYPNDNYPNGNYPNGNHPNGPNGR